MKKYLLIVLLAGCAPRFSETNRQQGRLVSVRADTMVLVSMSGDSIYLIDKRKGLRMGDWFTIKVDSSKFIEVKGKRYYKTKVLKNN